MFQVIKSELCRRFKKDPDVDINMATLLSRDIIEEDNVFLTSKVTDEEIQ